MSEQLRRKLNLIFQTTLIIILYLHVTHEIIPVKLILWQIAHFFYIALADYYLDDYSKKKRATTVILLIGYLLFMAFSLYYGIFDELYMRIHGMIVIFGNLLGKKVDNLFWKILTLVNLIIIAALEVLKNEFLAVFEIAILYIIGAMCLLGIAERLSEINRNFWMLHTVILFFWIIFKGPFYEEAYLFLIGGASYELFKILLNHYRKQEMQPAVEKL
ncbi:hypothetical protein [Arcticibacterium luteifluviistationis]|uniref:Uncharacterized protein n=1 Tax=Arcticibacterium luteifluviistationis TaxID=1784714 RepID=A0A2Z4GG92_9BACT|nr:hypothetical protein [Arcticibacterium luteifluviistationis]AWW00423.1 hypothetical protein DJ013_20485 [Arcticibacterium luteifluviistationis]